MYNRIPYFYILYFFITLQCFGPILNSPLYSQSKSRGNTFVHGPRETSVFGTHHFINGGNGILPGIVGTKRNSPTFFSFAGNSSVVGVSDAAHVDGYVKNYTIQNFTFPIGDNGVYGPVTMLAPNPMTTTNPISAAYYFTNSDNAITSSLQGGNEPPLPLGAPFLRTLRQVGISGVSPIEYWDVDGNIPVHLRFHWRGVSQISTLTSGMIMSLRMVGWDGSQWIDIPSVIDPGSDLTTGSLTTTSAIVPNTYSAYSFGVSCDLIDVTFLGIPNGLYLCEGETALLDIDVTLSGTSYTPDFVLERLEGNMWVDESGPNRDGIFNISGLAFNAPEKIFRIRINFGTCVRWSEEFTLESYKPSSLSCIGALNVSVDQNCELLVDPRMFLFDKTNNSEFYEVFITNSNGLPIQNPIRNVKMGEKYKVSIREKCSNNSCWSTMVIEDKLAPVIEECYENQSFSCYELQALKNETPHDHYTKSSNPVISRPPLIVENCGLFTAGFKDTEIKKTCGETEIIRDWFFADQFNNRSTCRQIFKFSPLTLNDLVAPITNLTLNCESDIKPSEIQRIFDNKSTTDSLNSKWVEENNEGSIYGGFTYLARGADGAFHNQIINDRACNIITKYTDEEIILNKNKCENERKIIRKWFVLDNCSNEFRFFNQYINLIDTIGPEYSVIAMKTSLQDQSCFASLRVPVPMQIRDNCSNISEIKWYVIPPNGAKVKGLQPEYMLEGLTKGRHELTYVMTDCSGNQSRKITSIHINDFTPPVPVTKSNIVVSLTSSSPENGFATLSARDLDNGSYDNCGPVYLEIRRDNNAPPCLNFGNVNSEGKFWNNNISYNSNINGNNQNTTLHVNDNELDTDKGQIVKFCCEDVGKEHKIWLRVWDDASGDGIFGNEGDNYNETWSTVLVEDKVVPKITCSPDLALDCDKDISAMTDYNFQLATGPFVNVEGKVSLSILPKIEGSCGGYDLEFRDIGSLNTCNIGSFKRTYRVKGFPSVQCTQLITIRSITQQPLLEHPISLHQWEKCTLSEEDVYMNTVRLSPSVREDVYGGCTTIELNIPATNSTMTAAQREAATTYGFTPNEGPLQKDLRNQARFNSNYKNIGCAIFGKKLTIEEYQVGEGCKKWLVKWHYINWCDNENAGCRMTIYKYEDTTPPAITHCPGTVIEIEEASCEHRLTLAPTAKDDNCYSEQNLIWRARIYEGHNLDIDSVAPPVREIINVTGTNPIFSFNGNGMRAPLKSGIYTIRYFVKDDCGNMSECDAKLVIRSKPATPYCVSISSAVMKNGLVELWARDFDNGSFTNCSTGALLFTFNRNGQAEHPVVSRLKREHYFKGLGQLAAEAEYNAGNAQKWLPNITISQRPNLPDGTPQTPDTTLLGGSSGKQFGCAIGDILGKPIVVEMRVWDTKSFKGGTLDGSDFCSTRLTLIDNQGGCGDGSLVTLGGSIMTEEKELMNGVEVKLKSNLPDYPIATKTDKNGKYAFGTLPIGVDYTIEPTKVGDYLNGVNTLDLVQIQRHILGIKMLDSPYKLIAADADGNEAIRVNDLVVLRKLILGITDKIEEMPSWRFVDASEKMEYGPWPFREVISHPTLIEGWMSNDFIGVKIGDVDGSAGANAVSKSIEPRSVGVRLIAEDKALKAGEEIEISFKAGQFTEVHGMQFTLRHEGLELKGVDGRAIELREDNIGKIQQNTTTLSWASMDAMSVNQGSEVIRLTFRAMKAVKLSAALQISSEVTSAEAYVGSEMERVGIVLEIRSYVLPIAFNVAQNEPNPWKTMTTIRYNLLEDGDVILTITDVTGRLIMSQTIKGSSGENIVLLSREQLNGATGVLIYKVESGKYNEQRKMLVLE